MASSSSLEDVRKIVREEIQRQQQTQGRSENIYQRTQSMIRDAASAVRRQSETSQGINTPPQRSFIHDPAAGTNTPTSMPIEAGSLQEENTPTNVQATIRNILGGQKNSRKRSVPGHPGEWRIIMNTQKSFALFYSFTTSYYFIFLGM